MKAKFSVVYNGEFVVIREAPGGPRMSITNDAEAVVKSLFDSGHAVGEKRLFYWDSMDVIDELVHNGAGRFSTFMPGKIEEWAYELYQAGGQRPVEELAQKLGIPFGKCEPCENFEPIYDGSCLVCGTWNQTFNKEKK